jgi:hypothetical protein
MLRGLETRRKACFLGRDRLNSIAFEDESMILQMEESCLQQIEDSCFVRCSLRLICTLESVESMGKSCFEGCLMKRLTLALGSQSATIEESCFARCLLMSFHDCRFICRLRDKRGCERITIESGTLVFSNCDLQQILIPARGVRIRGWHNPLLCF